MILDFNVRGQTLTAVPQSDIPRRGSREYLQLRFHFSDDWDNYTIKTVFFQHQDVYEPFFIDKTCVVDVPNYFTVQTHFLIALTGISADIQEFCPTNSIGISLGDSGVVFSAEPPNVPPSAYQQMLQYVQQVEEILSCIKTNVVRSVNDILPEKESGNVTLAPKDIPVQIPGAGIQNLQALLEALYAGPICSVSGMLMSSPAGSTLYQGAVTAGTLPEIRTGDEPSGVNTQIIFTPSGTNAFSPAKLMLQGQAIEIRRRAYPDLGSATEALPAKSLRKDVPYTLTFSGQYWLLDSYVPLVGSEHNVTELYQTWHSSNSNTVKDFFFSDVISEPGAYVVYAAGYTWKLRYTTASGGDGSSVWRWIVYYTEDGFFAVELYHDRELVISFDPDSGTYKIYEKSLVLENQAGEIASELKQLKEAAKTYAQALEVDKDGLVYLLNNKKRIAGPYGPFAGSGGVVEGVAVERQITIPVSGWRSNEEGTEPLCIDLAQTDITEDMVPFVSILPEGLKDAQKCGIGTTVRTLPGALRLYAQKVPETEIKASLLLIVSSSGGGYTLPVATATRLGGVKIGDGISVAEDGTISSKLSEKDLITSEETAEMLEEVFPSSQYKGGL